MNYLEIAKQQILGPAGIDLDDLHKVLARISTRNTDLADLYFDTDRIHTLLNGGDKDRITLSIDLIRNDWLRTWMDEHFTAELHQFCTARAMNHELVSSDTELETLVLDTMRRQGLLA